MLVVNGDQDMMLPSGEEGDKLVKLLPSCRAKVLAGRSHALLQEAGVDLVEILEGEGFLAERRVLTGRQASTAGERRANGFGRCGAAGPSMGSAVGACGGVHNRTRCPCSQGGAAGAADGAGV